MKIEETNAYKKLNNITQLIVSKSTSRKQILESVTIAKTIGVEKWESITNLPQVWRNIVKELVI
ncbi:hypothetical protein [Myroides injenensis]|uniref:hypothetical protein n=1 Tax=Myroides injenensis TaxID=1183151 RepID=UPI000289D62E|nr:hypothetical protein [Myroides injenensis]